MLIKKIIHQLTLLTLLTVLPAFQCLAEFTDTDWNMEFNDHCGFPKTEGDYKSVKWANDGPNKFLRFELRKNDAGLCEKDDRKRRSSSFRERAQVLQNNTLERDKKYSLEFEVRFVKGFHGIGERFLTLDQTTEGDPYTGVCNGPIPLSLAASSGLIYIQIIKSGPPISSPGLKHERVLKSGGKQNFGEWIKFKLVLDTSKNSKVSIYRNGKLMLDGHPFLIKNCAELNFSAGIYRYGGYNDTSIVNFDKFKLKTIEEDRLKTSVIAGREVKNNTLRYKNEAGDFVSFNILDTENFSTRYKISGFPGYDNTEVVKVVGGISISGGRPYSPHHRHLQTTIDPGNQAKLKTFLTKPLGSSVTYQVQ
ncbi:MAG: heparin lyase I family protein, partial [Pseudomonadota bacterium]|nr:heparin lyase I family protein [Pseudomonadota bacterium]